MLLLRVELLVPLKKHLLIGVFVDGLVLDVGLRGQKRTAREALEGWKGIAREREREEVHRVLVDEPLLRLLLRRVAD